MWTLLVPIIGIVALAFIAQWAITKQMEIDEYDRARDAQRRNRRYIARMNWEYVEFEEQKQC
jgi:hypothetical protein